MSREVDDLVRACAPTTRVRRGGRRGDRLARRLAIGGTAAVVALAGVGAAAASPWAPDWLAWDRVIGRTPGQCALLSVKVVPDRGAQGLDDPAVVAGRKHLATMDLDDLDYSRQLQEQRSMDVTDGVTGEYLGTGEELYTEEWIEFNAWSQAISAAVFDEVRRQGYDASKISIEGQSTGCAEEIERTPGR
ncbi:hypothetical protein [Kineococcus arenarius]|uniref:hypothetical protein n=1 Tax=unclassified Kineococcus TaxID=2621656 RepID=UPI003D7E0046